MARRVRCSQARAERALIARHAATAQAAATESTTQNMNSVLSAPTSAAADPTHVPAAAPANTAPAPAPAPAPTPTPTLAAAAGASAAADHVADTTRASAQHTPADSAGARVRTAAPPSPASFAQAWVRSCLLLITAVALSPSAPAPARPHPHSDAGAGLGAGVGGVGPGSATGLPQGDQVSARARVHTSALLPLPVYCNRQGVGRRSRVFYAIEGSRAPERTAAGGGHRNASRPGPALSPRRCSLLQDDL